MLDLWYLVFWIYDVLVFWYLGCLLFGTCDILDFGMLGFLVFSMSGCFRPLVVWISGILHLCSCSCYIGFGYFGVFVMAETVVFISATFSSIGAFLRELWPFLCFRGPHWVILEYLVLFFTFGGS